MFISGWLLLASCDQEAGHTSLSLAEPYFLAYIWHSEYFLAPLFWMRGTEYFRMSSWLQFNPWISGGGAHWNLGWSAINTDTIEFTQNSMWEKNRTNSCSFWKRPNPPTNFTKTSSYCRAILTNRRGNISFFRKFVFVLAGLSNLSDHTLCCVHSWPTHHSLSKLIMTIGAWTLSRSGHTVLTESKLMPRKLQITFSLYVRAKFSFDQCRLYTDQKEISSLL